MSRTHWMPRMAALMTVLAVAACGDDGTGPGDQPFNAEQAVENYAAVNVVLDSEPFQSFQNIGGVVFGGATNEAFDVLRGQGSAGRFMAAHDATISEENRGKTFVYDATEMEYVWDEERTGAPETGVRFIIYSEDGSGNPDPEDERGYADLIDLGDESTSDMVLRLEGVYDAVQFLEYQLEVNNDEETGAVDLAVDGFLSDGTERLDFEIDAASSSDETTNETTTTLAYRLRIDARNFEVNSTLTLVLDSQENESSTVDMTVQHGTDVVRLEATGDDTMVNGTITVGGEIFALVTGDPDNPTITKADGSSLTASEIQALANMISFVGELFIFMNELLTPVSALIFLGAVL